MRDWPPFLPITRAARPASMRPSAPSPSLKLETSLPHRCARGVEPDRARATRLEELRLAAAEAQKKMSDEQAAVRVQLEAEWAEIERQRAMQIREEHRRQVAHHTSQLEMEREQLETMREQLRKRRAAGIIQARACACCHRLASPRTPARSLVTPGRMGDPPHTPSNHPFAPAPLTRRIPPPPPTGARPQDASREDASPLRDGRSSGGGAGGGGARGSGGTRRSGGRRHPARASGHRSADRSDGPDVCDGSDDGGARRRGGGGRSDRTGCSTAA